MLEPSAGLGAIVREIDRKATQVTAIEINEQSANALRQEFGVIGLELVDVQHRDFLTCNGELGKFDRIFMNPPFSGGDDVRHILHARKMLTENGVLVAICANGPKQQAALMGIADEWIDLPPGSFKSSGTNVNVTIVIL